MNLWIDNKSGIPIYEQIFTQIKGQIVSGELAENTPLPSIRNLAKDLRISVITTKRAYDELERAGFVYTIPAKGCFVAPRNVELLREEHLRRIEEHLREAVELASAACRGRLRECALQ
jgi:GntR family transcriptional regulator